MFEQQPASVSALHVPVHRFDTVGLIDAAISSINHQCKTGERRNIVIGYDTEGELVLAHAFDYDTDEDVADYVGNEWEKVRPQFWYTVVYNEWSIAPNAKIVAPLDTVIITTGSMHNGSLDIYAALGLVRNDGFHPTLARYLNVVNDSPVFIFSETMRM